MKQAERATDHATDRDAEPAAAAAPRLMAIEDEPVNSRVIYEVFRNDCQVLTARDGTQGLDLVRRQLLARVAELDAELARLKAAAD